MNKMLMLWGTILFTFGCWKACKMDTFYVENKVNMEARIRANAYEFNVTQR